VANRESAVPNQALAEPMQLARQAGQFCRLDLENMQYSYVDLTS
jgi:hypothetical protein